MFTTFPNNIKNEIKYTISLISSTSAKFFSNVQYLSTFFSVVFFAARVFLVDAGEREESEGVVWFGFG